MASHSATLAKAARGGSFLIEEQLPADVFTPEDLSDEHRQILKTTNEFTNKEVIPLADKLEAKDWGLTRELLKKAGSLGLLAVDIPEAYGGLGLDKVTSSLVAEGISKLAGFSVSLSAHTGIGTLPIVWYGTEAQKQKYLPKMATGEWVGAYALSEATSGSDAMNIRTRATLSPDGTQWILNGEKMWISNSGFADLFVVFAKIDGEKFSTFLVERGTPGLSVGKEEHKLGIHSSSTCPLVLSDCRIPVDHLLGEAGKGHYIAFNVLNIGRYKLGAACVGGARHSLNDGIRYAKERKAFGKSIAEFGLIQEKLAECAVGVYAGEAIAYRTVGMIDAALRDVDQKAPDASREIQKRIEEYAVECSILKVWGSEMLDMVVDHVLQIYGGYGYVEDYPAERAYRDSRINRIFEGTNEINRLIITGRLLKHAVTGQLPLLPAIKRIMDEVMAGPGAPEHFEGPLSNERNMLAAAKKLGLFAAGAASQKYMTELAEQQEIVGALADGIMEIYTFESCLLRAEKVVETQGEAAARIPIAMTKYYGVRAMERIELAARRVLAAVAEGDMLRTQMTILRRLARFEPADTIALGRQIAQHVVTVGRYAI